MADAITVSAPISGTDRTLSFETGKLANLADGAVLARIGDTILLATATAARSVREGTDFFPLTVDIEERAYAAGKIPGSFFRREGKASDQAILTCRLIDRPLRPSFPKGFRNEVHVVGTIFGADQVNPHDVLAINAASAALMLSGIPFEGPIGAVRIAYSTEGTWIPHPTYQEGDESTFELVVAGRALSDDERGRDGHHDGRGRRHRAVVGATTRTAPPRSPRRCWPRASRRPRPGSASRSTSSGGWWRGGGGREGRHRADRVLHLLRLRRRRLRPGRGGRHRAGGQGQRHRRQGRAATRPPTRPPPRSWPSCSGEFPDREREIKAAVRSLTKKLVRARIVSEGVRIDGRGTADIRPLSAEVDLFPTAHGSALFQRGETQVLNVTTLGMPRMNQMLDTISPDESKRYMHHYNFPPFSTGETGFMRGPKRREIGHGLLAERALLPVVPPKEEFPYTLRLVSDVLASNGSTSMASVCGSTLSLMAAGVPIKAPVAGIAMGLVYDGGRYVTLTDILGAEDAFGDMDFKVAGTADAVTALQLDTKIDGLPADVLAQALLQAKEARLKILEVMPGAIAEPRHRGGGQRPQDRLDGDPDRQDRRGHRAQGQGHQHPAAGDRGRHRRRRRRHGRARSPSGPRTASAVEEARRRISLILDPPTADVGAVYPGKVVNITKFGAFVNVLPGPRRPAAHLQALAAGRRQAGRPGGGRPLPGPERRGPGGRHRPAGQGVAVAGQRARGLREATAGRRPRRAARALRAAATAASGTGREPVRRGATAGAGGPPVVSFEDAFEAELVADLGDLGPGAVAADERRGDGGGDRRPRSRSRRR